MICHFENNNSHLRSLTHREVIRAGLELGDRVVFKVAGRALPPVGNPVRGEARACNNILQNDFVESFTCPQTPKFCIRASNEIKITEDVFWLLSME